jgi:DNA-binding protein H-NS
MWIAISLLVLLVVGWFFLRSGDSSYQEMADDVNAEAEAQTAAYLERQRAEEQEAKKAKEQEALSKAKYALIDHPKYGTVTWSGRGRKPKWLVEYLEAGGLLESIEINRKT